MSKITRVISFLGLLALTACISGVKEPDTYTDRTGKTTVIESDHEMCVRACNEEYARCMDTRSAQDNSGVNGPAGMFGASADCRNDLQSCLPSCQAR